MSGKETTINASTEIFTPDDEDFIKLELLDLGKTITTFTHYTFHSDFLTPNSSFSFDIADDRYFDVLKQVQNGQKVAIRINNNISFTGYVDQMNVISSPSGTIMQIRGRDALGPICDATMDPRIKYNGDHTVIQLVTKLIEDFGMKVEIMGYIDLAKVTGTTGRFYSVADTNHIVVEVKSILNVPLNSKLKPHRGEGIYEYIERLGKHFGFHAWAALDGKSIILGTPTYKAPPLYRITHKNAVDQDNANNIAIESTMSVDWTKQPTAIMAFGNNHGSGEYRKGTTKCIMVNELLCNSNSDIPQLAGLIKSYPEATLIPRRSSLKKPDFVVVPKFSKPLFFHDDEAKTMDQLVNRVRHQMSELQSKFLTVSYTINRHSQSYKDGRNVWAPNTMVDVDDDVNNIHQTLWIKGRTFTKDSSGTKTVIECILPNTIQFTKTEF